MTIYEEVFTAASSVGLKPMQAGQDERAYFKEMAEKLSTISDESWNKLSETAQAWYNETAKAINQGKDIPACEGFVSGLDQATAVVEELAAEAASTEVASPTATEPKKRKYTKTVSKAEKVPQKSATGAAVDTPRQIKPIKMGVINTIRKTAMLNPQWTAKHIHQYLTEQGFDSIKYETVASYVSEIHSVMSLAKELGLWNTNVTTPAEEPRVEQPV